MKLNVGIIPFLLISSLTGCAQVYDEEIYHIPLEDKYRTYYEIFPGSYYDSDGDGIGDLNGITSKLDYIHDLGFNGIWMTPIFEGGSYHKYDTIDYLSIDSSFGTMDDLDNLIEEAHKRDIAVILDLVVNHTSSENEWFKKGIRAFKDGGGQYSDYYNFSLEVNDFCTTRDSFTGVYYEAKFNYDMPDLNLDSENVRNEIKNIMKYYLDKGIDGFRLDAVTSYYTANQDKNLEFLTWLNDTGKSINPNCYFVGEAWTGTGEIKRYYESGIDSFFSYDPDSLGKRLNTYIIRNYGDGYFDKMKSLISTAGDGIPAPFITNHDNARAVNVLNSKKDDDAIKFGQGLMQMMTGTTFTYYGDEIGMVGINPPDQNVRTAMFWGDENGTCNNPSGTTESENVYPSVKDQLKDADSILYYYKKANNLRNKYEVIRKGEVEQLALSENSLQVIKKTYNNSSIYLLINFNIELPGVEATKEIDLSSLNLGEFTYDYLVVDNGDEVKVDGNKVTLPKQSIVIIKGK